MRKRHKVATGYGLGAIHLWQPVVNLLSIMKVEDPDDRRIFDGQVLVVLAHLHGFWAAHKVDLEPRLKISEVVYAESICLQLVSNVLRVDTPLTSL